MAYFGLWSTTTGKQGGADALAESEISARSSDGVSLQDDIISSLLLKRQDAVPCESAFVELAPSTPELGAGILAETVSPGRGRNHGTWEGPLARKDPLPTPFAALANESTSFKSTESEGPEVVGPVPQDPTPSVKEAEEDEPSTAAVVFDIFTQLFIAKSAEPAKREKTEEVEKPKAKEEEGESAAVALYFPYSANGPPPPPPIPSECVECMVWLPSLDDWISAHYVPVCRDWKCMGKFVWEAKNNGALP